MSENSRATFRCAVTGTSGYLGGHLARRLEDAGVQVTRLSSSSSAAAVPFSLGGDLPEGTFKDHRIDSLVHCAWDFSLTREQDIWKVNVEGSIRLFNQARREGVSRLIFISTMSAFDDCRSLYGKAKLAVERVVFDLGGPVIRPGLIYGEQPRGMVGALLGVLGKVPVVPLIGNGDYVLYLVHEDDLAALVSSQVKKEAAISSQPIIAAHDTGYTFKEILRSFACLQGIEVKFVAIPASLIRSSLAVAESVGLKLPFRSDSVTSLINQDPSPDFTETRECGITFRAFSEYLTEQLKTAKS
jgi:nucleoside-diphosphate-sugar epimerase